MKKSKAMIDQILSMHKQGVSIRKIARALGLSRNTVRGHVREY
jgi:DNA-binding NarL/FixJ family response regulator